MKNGGGHFAPKLGGHFELESGGHFKLELGGQYDWNLQYEFSITSSPLVRPYLTYWWILSFIWIRNLYPKRKRQFA